MDILVGILLVALGAAVATMGLRLWFWILPVLGFMSGFFLGTLLVFHFAGDGILATVLSWIVGLVIGIAFSLISVLWWYVGAIIAMGTSGALLGSGILATFGVDARWALLIAAIIGAALFAFLGLVYAVPLYIVIFNTALVGGIAVVSGVLMMFNQIDRSDLGTGHAVAIINDSLLWWLAWIAVAVAGAMVQLRQQAAVVFPEERFVPTSNAISR
ncbi:MAG TPA: DUF4203 domain-containing protein [Thermomicrobiales bacterium]|nr:DUF4203 domain-containing protein [Thermomicrobiales bacterium]